jgi:mannose-binding lectin 1
MNMQAGYIRGFLNDGTVDYTSHHSVDGLAFGHCEYAYRNLGRPSTISIRHSENNFRVDVDGRLCFESSKIRLPTGYNFGVTAASSETPDSFEIFKFVVTNESNLPAPDAGLKAAAAAGGDQQLFGGGAAGSPDGQKAAPKVPVNKAAPGSIPAFSADPPDVPASSIAVDSQFADLHNRLQAMMKHISALNRDASQSHAAVMARANDLEAKIVTLGKSMERLDALVGMEKRLGEIHADVRQTKADLHNSLDRHASGIKEIVRDTHRTMLGSIAASAPTVLGYIFVVLGSQVLTVVAYVVYKRRKAAGSKKYL